MNRTDHSIREDSCTTILSNEMRFFGWTDRVFGSFHLVSIGHTSGLGDRVSSRTMFPKISAR